MSKAVPPEVRKLRQDLHKRQQRDAAAKALAWSDKHRPWNSRAGDRSKYFPHQSEREMARRVRQAASHADFTFTSQELTSTLKDYQARYFPHRL